eukprot:10759640-Alexandrium_andersonii.AAC.1
MVRCFLHCWCEGPPPNALRVRRARRVLRRSAVAPARCVEQPKPTRGSKQDTKANQLQIIAHE